MPGGFGLAQVMTAAPAEAICRVDALTAMRAEWGVGFRSLLHRRSHRGIEIVVLGLAAVGAGAKRDG